MRNDRLTNDWVRPTPVTEPADGAAVTSRGDGVAVVDKAVDLLECLADGGAWTVADAAAASRVTRTAAYRILGTLERRGWVSRQDGLRRYVLGPSLLALARARTGTEDLLVAARPFMRRLWETYGETVNLGVMAGGRVRYLDMVETEQRLRMTSLVGSEDPLHSTALGKAMLACLPEAEVRRILLESNRERRTEHTVYSIPALLMDLEQARDAGYAVDNEENEPGARCVAAAIRSRGGRPLAALSIAAPTQRLAVTEFQRIGQSLQHACAQLEQRLQGAVVEAGLTSPSEPAESLA